MTVRTIAGAVKVFTSASLIELEVYFMHTALSFKLGIN